MRVLPLCSALLLATLLPAGEGAEVVRLENAAVVVEVVPRLGGRIATIRRPDGENVLAFARDLLLGADAQLPQPAADGPYLPGNGHVIWVGPQAEWWTRQQLNPERRDAHATWPPDPWLEYGTMQVIERTPERVRLAGPASPVSGLRLSTSVSIAADGAVLEEIEAVNAGTAPVSWDLWPNTRVRGDAVVYVPCGAGDPLKVVFNTWDVASELPFPPLLRSGYFSFDTRLAPGTEGLLHLSKAYLRPAASQLFAVAPEDLLVMAARTPAKGTVHPDQAPVEVFQSRGGSDRLRQVIELEFHSAYTNLAPGEALRYAVAWRVLPFAGGDESAQLAAVQANAGMADRLRLLVGP